MTTENTFNLSLDAAEKYEAFSVPAMFEPLASATLETLPLPGDAHVLDVACGTGIVSRLVAEKMGGVGRIVGADLNPAMIEIAKSSMPPSGHRVEWFVSDVTNMPFSDGEFGIAIMQQGLQFFPDKPRALAEVRRVLSSNGLLVLTCWKAVSPAFQAISDSLRQHVSEKAAEQAVAPFSFRDGELITGLLNDAGFLRIDLSTVTLERKWVSVRDQMLTSPYEKELLAIGKDGVDTVVNEVERALASFRVAEEYVVPQETHLFLAHTY